MYDASKTVREFVIEVPQAIRLFEKMGIDYCCGGGIPLTQACATANISVDEVLQKLAAGSDKSTDAPSDWRQAELSDLVDHIVAKHHIFVKQELPRLEQLLNKVAGKHTEKHPELKQVKTVFARLNEELTSHLQKEETILFPYVKGLEATQNQPTSGRAPAFGSVRNPIHMMEIEHDSAGDALRELRKITSGYTAPEEGCGSYKALYQGFMELEADLHEHIHLENNILFPRAIEMEKRAKE